jgi:hypothetical protein
MLLAIRLSFANRGSVKGEAGSADEPDVHGETLPCRIETLDEALERAGSTY